MGKYFNLIDEREDSLSKSLVRLKSSKIGSKELSNFLHKRNIKAAQLLSKIQRKNEEYFALHRSKKKQAGISKNSEIFSKPPYVFEKIKSRELLIQPVALPVKSFKKTLQIGFDNIIDHYKSEPLQIVRRKHRRNNSFKPSERCQFPSLKTLLSRRSKASNNKSQSESLEECQFAGKYSDVWGVNGFKKLDSALSIEKKPLVKVKAKHSLTDSVNHLGTLNEVTAVKSATQVNQIKFWDHLLGCYRSLRCDDDFGAGGYSTNDGDEDAFENTEAFSRFISVKEKAMIGPLDYLTGMKKENSEYAVNEGCRPELRKSTSQNLLAKKTHSWHSIKISHSYTNHECILPSRNFFFDEGEVHSVSNYDKTKARNDKCSQACKSISVSNASLCQLSIVDKGCSTISFQQMTGYGKNESCTISHDLNGLKTIHEVSSLEQAIKNEQCLPNVVSTDYESTKCLYNLVKDKVDFYHRLSNSLWNEIEIFEKCQTSTEEIPCVKTTSLDQISRPILSPPPEFRDDIEPFSVDATTISYFDRNVETPYAAEGLSTPQGKSQPERRESMENTLNCCRSKSTLSQYHVSKEVQWSLEDLVPRGIRTAHSFPSINKAESSKKSAESSNRYVFKLDIAIPHVAKGKIPVSFFTQDEVTPKDKVAQPEGIYDKIASQLIQTDTSDHLKSSELIPGKEINSLLKRFSNLMHRKFPTSKVSSRPFILSKPPRIKLK